MDSFLIASRFQLEYPIEIVVVGLAQSIINAVHKQFNPNRLIYWYEKGGNMPTWEVLEDRLHVDKPTVYICRGQTCSLPLTSAEEISAELQRTNQLA